MHKCCYKKSTPAFMSVLKFSLVHKVFSYPEIYFRYNIPQYGYNFCFLLRTPTY